MNGVSMRVPGLIAGWAWMLLAGGGGLWLLIARGPWPPTNGWFALFSGLAACPLIALSTKKHRRAVAWAQVGAAIFFFVAGRLALLIWLR